MTDAASGLVAALRADGPLPELADELMLFGQFVGAWDVDGWLLERDGSHSPHRGEWHFGWALEGRAVQDVLISPPLAEIAAGAQTVEYGTTIRFYDRDSGVWRAVYLTPVNGAIVELVGRAEGPDIHLDGRLPDGRRSHWTFTEIGPDGFLWQGRVSGDGGRSWSLEEEMRARRRG